MCEGPGKPGWMDGAHRRCYLWKVAEEATRAGRRGVFRCGGGPDQSSGMYFPWFEYYGQKKSFRESTSFADLEECIKFIANLKFREDGVQGRATPFPHRPSSLGTTSSAAPAIYIYELSIIFS